MPSTRRAFLRSLLALAGGFAPAGSALQQAHARADAARFRVLHAIPDLGAVDVYGNRVRIARGLTHTRFSSTWGIAAESMLVRAFPAGADRATSPLLATNVPLARNQSQLIVLADLSTAPRVLVFPQLTRAARGQFTLRLMHLAPGFPVLSLTRTDGSPLIAGVPFGEAQTNTFAAGRYALELRDAATGAVLARIGQRAFSSGARQTVYVFGAAPAAAREVGAPAPAPRVLILRE
ncbi:MAG: DUF4397 domain-containing protein [Anaerolineae bacterium]|nr:DUF4397 domain-containing protein [Anaerolineae bacterium]